MEAASAHDARLLYLNELLGLSYPAEGKVEGVSEQLRALGAISDEGYQIVEAGNPDATVFVVKGQNVVRVAEEA